MLVLSSGKIVDLSTDRAKYHALRKPGGVNKTSEHRALYSVVDIICRYKNNDGIPCRGWTEYDFHYSGATLSSLRLDTDWSDDEKQEILRWAQQPGQIRIIETARRRLAENQKQLSNKQYSAPQHLHSFLKKRILVLPLQKATLAQWQATINNMRNKGIRKEEIQWSGLPQYFKTQSPDTLLSKQQLLRLLNFENIRIALNTEQIRGTNGGLSFEEIAQRMPHQAVYRAALKLDDSCDTILRFRDQRYNYRVGVVKTLRNGHNMALNKYWFALDPYGRAIPNEHSKNREVPHFFESSIEAKTTADKHAREHLGMRSGVNTHTHFDHLTLFGGEDYREWTVTLPDFQRTFFGAHFYDHNVLAHIRTTTRIDKSGQRLLFIEEIQSDWHQSGKRYGYDTSAWGQVANAPFKKEWAALATKLMLIHASQNGFAGVAWPMGDIQEVRYKRGLHAIKHHYDTEIPRTLNRLGRSFQSRVSTTSIETRDPWLTLEKSENKWRVADNLGKFKTRAKYDSRHKAMTVITRHCRNLDLEIPVFYISDEMRQQIAENGLPLFGETKNQT